MKKQYETPMVEKIRFDYRDQVVVASAGGIEEDVVTGGNTPSTGEQFIGWAAQGLGISGCANYECTSLADWTWG